MALIKTIEPDQAEGAVKEAYDTMLERIPFVPKPLQMMSANPELLSGYMQNMRYFMAHQNLSPLLMAYIRMLAAFNSDYPYCIDLNSGFLKQFAGLSDDQLNAVREDPANAPLDDKEKAMLAFVVKSIKSPEEVSKTDIDHLTGLGWTEKDCFDALFQGANMVATGILFNAFKMGDV
jgi:alkylhydroperoxidase family enzyme